MENEFNLLLYKLSKKTKAKYLDLLNIGYDNYNLFTELEKDFIKTLITIMPEEFLDALLETNILTRDDCCIFINTVMFNYFLGLNHLDPELIKKNEELNKVFFDALYKKMLSYIRNYELMSKRRKELEEKKEYYYKTYQNEMLMITMKKASRSYFKTVLKRLGLKVKDLRDSLVISFCENVGNIYVEFNIIKEWR